MDGNALDKGRLMWMGKTTVPLTFVLTSDLAAYPAAAVGADIRRGERIDIGWDGPVKVREVASLTSNCREDDQGAGCSRRHHPSRMDGTSAQ